MIGSKIPNDDYAWANFLLIMEIVDRLFAPQIDDDDAAYLRILICDHHTEFCQIYPEESIIPKMHFMVHMPRLMIEYGPLIRHWTMRYEAKHSYFKRVAQAMGNFINLPYSLAMRHQFLQCHHNAVNVDTLGTQLLVGPGSITSIADLEELNETSAFEANWIEIDGIRYKKGTGIICKVDFMPQISQITSIYIIKEKQVVFKVINFKTEYYDSHYRAYIITSTGTSTVLQAEKLVVPNPIHIRSFLRRKLFILPYHVKTT